MSGDTVPTDNRTRLRLRLRRMTAVAAVSILALVGCSGSNVNPAIDIATVDGRPGFVPPTITVETDDKVDLKVTNATDKTHGFRIEGYGITRLVDPTAPPEQVKFTAYRGGTFRIMCQLHEAHQTATLVVV
ncbi:MAG: cupredoxin domain-containing protein [Acidimicrobiales bacterium]